MAPCNLSDPGETLMGGSPYARFFWGSVSQSSQRVSGPFAETPLWGYGAVIQLLLVTYHP